ncbi:MAG TPA: methionyl-tRNA formyltransferase [Gemmatimonadales bacterium]
MRVLFYGTPDFAVPSLTALVGEGFDVAAVVTRPDKPTGRHRSSADASPVKLAALDEDIPVLQPDSPSAPDFLAEVRTLKPEVAIVVAYGHLLKTDLLGIPAHGSLNLHASLLPRLRGAAPIERAILEGFTETGVSIMKMEAGLDTGPVLHIARTPIAADETGGELRARLAEIGAMALIEALTLLGESPVEPTPQDHAAATLAPKLTRAEERIDWTQSAAQVSRKIRAFDPRPGAWTEIRGKPVKLFGARAGNRHQEGQRPEAEVASGQSGRRMEDAITTLAAPGTIMAVGEKLIIACADGIVGVTDVQPAGKARMTVRDFLNGRGAAEGDVLR